MTEEPAPRAPHAPQATQTPAPARGEGPGSGRPPQGDTAPLSRAREAAELAKAVIVAKWRRIAYPDAQPKEAPVTEPVRWNVCPDCLGRHPDGAACLDEPPTGDLSERLDAALRTVGLARNLAAYRDAVLPVVEEIRILDGPTLSQQERVGAEGGGAEARTVLHQLIRVAAHVSRGRSAVDVEPYPDALARRALGALDDATVRAALDQPKETP